MKTLILIAFTALLLQCPVRLTVPQPPVVPTRVHTSATLASDLPCKSSLWANTYGAMKRFGRVIDRTRLDYRTELEHRCVKVKGKVVYGPLPQKDGDLKLKIQIDEMTFVLGFYKREDLLKPENHGLLPVEIICHHKPTNTDCADCFKVCEHYTHSVYEPHHGEWIDVTGELVEDTGAAGNPPSPSHGGYEIHPVTSIVRHPL